MCRERYINVINPERGDRGFQPEEDERILTLVGEMNRGPNDEIPWSTFQRDYFPNRTGADLKRRHLQLENAKRKAERSKRKEMENQNKRNKRKRKENGEMNVGDEKQPNSMRNVGDEKQPT